MAVIWPGCGIFIKNIFIDTTAEDLEREFSKFGIVLGGAKGINLKPPKLSHETKFAFIDFDEPASAQAALEATVELHGKVLAVEMKKASVVNAKGVSGNGKKDSKAVCTERVGVSARARKMGKRRLIAPLPTSKRVGEALIAIDDPTDDLHVTSRTDTIQRDK